MRGPCSFFSHFFCCPSSSSARIARCSSSAPLAQVQWLLAKVNTIVIVGNLRFAYLVQLGLFGVALHLALPRQKWVVGLPVGVVSLTNWINCLDVGTGSAG